MKSININDISTALVFETKEHSEPINTNIFGSTPVYSISNFALLNEVINEIPARVKSNLDYIILDRKGNIYFDSISEEEHHIEKYNIFSENTDNREELREITPDLSLIRNYTDELIPTNVRHVNIISDNGTLKIKPEYTLNNIDDEESKKLVMVDADRILVGESNQKLTAVYPQDNGLFLIQNNYSIFRVGYAYKQSYVIMLYDESGSERGDISQAYLNYSYPNSNGEAYYDIDINNIELIDKSSKVYHMEVR